MSYIAKTKSFFRTLYTIISGTALVLWVFAAGTSSDSEQAWSWAFDIFDINTVHADTPPTSCGDDIPRESGGCCSEGSSGSSSGTGATCCFPGTVKVETENGLITIADLKEGDTVVSYDEKTSTFAQSRVGKVLVHSKSGGDVHDFAAHPLMKLVYEDGGNDTELFVTANHPILDHATKTYKHVAEFAVGDAIVSKSGSVVIKTLEQIDETEHVGADGIVYNLSLIDGPNTYVAGGIVVHNKGATCG